MQAIQATGTVNKKRQLIVQMPFEMKQGDYEVIVVLLQPPAEEKKHHHIIFSNHKNPINGMTFSRSEIYDDDGR